MVFRPTALLSMLALLASATSAQDARWNAVQSLSAGETLRVVTEDGRSHQGQLQATSNSSLVLNSGTFQRENVKHISVAGQSRRRRHALIGAAIGAGAGLAVGAAIDADCSRTSIVCTGNKGKAILTPVFGLLSAGIGAVLPSRRWHEIY